MQVCCVCAGGVVPSVENLQLCSLSPLNSVIKFRVSRCAEQRKGIKLLKRFGNSCLRQPEHDQLGYQAASFMSWLIKAKDLLKPLVNKIFQA